MTAKRKYETVTLWYVTPHGEEARPILGRIVNGMFQREVPLPSAASGVAHARSLIDLNAVYTGGPDDDNKTWANTVENAVKIQMRRLTESIRCDDRWIERKVEELWKRRVVRAKRARILRRLEKWQWEQGT